MIPNLDKTITFAVQTLKRNSFINLITNRYGKKH